MKLLSIKVAGIVAVSMLAGCASTSDVEGIQTQIDSLKVSAAQVATDATNARTTASVAAEKSTAAQIAADRAAQLSLAASAKLDKLFKQSQLK